MLCRQASEFAKQRSEPRRSAGRIATAAILAFLGSGLPRAQPGPPASFEHEVKASFVYTVAKFVDWPADAFGGPETPLIFAVLGEDPIEEQLEHTVEGKSVAGHPIEVIRLKDVNDPQPCHVLFVSLSEAVHEEEVIARRRGSSVLTVGESERFAQRGGVMQLTLDQNMVRFEVNVDAAQRAHLQISSKILKLGKIVRDRKHAAGAP